MNERELQSPERVVKRVRGPRPRVKKGDPGAKGNFLRSYIFPILPRLTARVGFWGSKKLSILV